jgi:hypothetical protein
MLLAGFTCPEAAATDIANKNAVANRDALAAILISFSNVVNSPLPQQ